jgi:hypothetical protein
MNPSDKPSTPEILLRFFDQFGSGAEGHSREALTTEQEAMLQAFSDGGITGIDRGALVSILSENEAAMERLAELLKPS